MGLKQRLNYYASFSDKDVFNPNGFNPGLFDTNKKKLKKLRPKVYSFLHLFAGNSTDSPAYIISQMNDGDIQPAIVVSTDPLLVACYVDEFDAVVMLCFPTELGKKRGWDLHKRLITVNAYNGLGTVRRNKDIYPGPRASKKYKSAGPIVAELYTDNMERVERKVSEIPEELWQYTLDLGNQYLVQHPGVARNGLDFAFKEAKKISEIRFSSKIKLD